MQRYIYIILLLIQTSASFTQNIATDDYIGFYQDFLSSQKTADALCIPPALNTEKWPLRISLFPKP